ncbi:MAG: hypothetical protein JXB88_16800 [Spirochaetales bacterium]|nr:hypothetical protein [Spirochaetales bacterium]
MEINPVSKNQWLFLRHLSQNNNRVNDTPLVEKSNTLQTYSGINQELQSIDSAVKAHEKTHLLGLGPYASSGIAYDYLILPGGQKYAVGGSVGVDLKPVPGDPEATIRKARIIRSSALAPHEPSAADKQVAAKAYEMEMEARKQLEKETQEENDNEEITPGVYNDMDKDIPDIMPVPGNHEATIRKARMIRHQILMQGKMTTRNRQILAESYQIEKQARKEMDKQKEESNSRYRIDVYA